MDLINILFPKKDIIDYESLKNGFKLPIEYQDSCKIIDNNLLQDLELETFKNIDLSNSENSEEMIKKNLYYFLFNPKNNFEEPPISVFNKYYSNDKFFLLDTQNIINKFNIDDYKFNFNDSSCNYDNVVENYENIINSGDFIDYYDYINLPYFSKFNSNDLVMQLWSSYNILSPIITLLIPIFSLLLPFFIIKLQGHDINMQLYIEHLKNVLKNHALGTLFSDFKNISFSSAIYIMFTIALYIFQIYSNISSCKKYFNNFKYINKSLFNLKNYLNESINNMKFFSNMIDEYISYKSFNDHLKNIILKLEFFTAKIKYIIHKNIYSDYKNYVKIGNIMTDFYSIYNDSKLISGLYYSFNFNGYLKNLINIKQLVNSDILNKCTFNENKNTLIKKSSYIGLLDTKIDNIVNNDVSFNKNILLTGPNASGKTTFLKSSLFNIILSQQIGFGFYESANIKIYDFFHCYINIPDTNERDSLFQAEAKKCKKIIDIVKEHSNSKHFCVFDEIFSGTNPDDAIKGGSNYLNYLNKYKNVDYILTTHYNKLCKKINKSSVKNLKTKVNRDSNNNFEFTYKIQTGINEINGGTKILKDLEFPEEIIKN